MWLSTTEAALKLGVSSRAIRAAIQRGSQKYIYKELSGQGGRGGLVYEIWVDETACATDDLPSPERAQQDNALPMLDLPHGKPTAQDKIKLVYLYEQLVCDGMKADDVFKIINTHYPTMRISERTFFRWRDAFFRSGSAALKDKRGGNNRRIDEAVLKEVAIAYGDVHLTNLYDAYKIKCALNEGKLVTTWIEASHISYAGFVKAYYRLLESDPHVKRSIKGVDNLLELTPKARRKPMARNVEWQIDASPFDFMVLAAVQRWDSHTMQIITDRKPVRATAIQIVDKGTGRRVWGLFESPNSYANVRLLKKALLALGKPKSIKGDNGADYISVHFQKSLELLGIAYIKSRPFRGNDKGAVERSFRTIMHGRLELVPGFIGHDVAQRQRIENRALSKAEQISGAQTQLDTLLTWEDMEAMLDAHIEMESKRLGWLDKWNRSNSELVMLDEWEINRCIGKRKEYVRFGTTGVTFNKMEYQNLDLATQGWINRKVHVAEDIDDIRRVHLFSTEDERYLGSATNSYLVNHTVEQMRRAEQTATKPLRKLKSAAKAVEKEIGATVTGFYTKHIEAAKQKRKDAVLMKQTRETNSHAAFIERDSLEALLLQRYEEEDTGT